MNECVACGHENRINAIYCAGCGTLLEIAAAEGSGAEIVSLNPEPETIPVVADEEGSGPVSTPQSVSSTSQAVAPLPVDEVIADRFRILELLAISPERNRYRALDLAFCHSCGCEDNAVVDEYCHKCGAALEPRRVLILDEQLLRPPVHFDVHLTADEREYYGVYEKETAAITPLQPSALQVRWGRATDQGRSRDHNEDYSEGWIYSCNGRTQLGLFVVADGLGGQDSGEVASQMTTDTLWQSIRTSFWEPTTSGQDAKLAPEEALRQAVVAANETVLRTRLERKSQMSSTVTVALLVDKTIHIANVGDCRTYVFSAQGLTRITKDHSLVQRLVDTGQITPEEVYTHPRRNLIYQSIGDRPDVLVDLYRHEFTADERLVLCSDGMWEMVHDDGLEEVLLAEADPQRACDRLVINANLAGGVDNISIIIVQLFH
ncbi:MAG: PP2C family protein-serine/threonine phosphatase [Anaerolineae bacterium]